jgi:Sap, sulfolipid-1-addressing protein
LSRVFLFSLTAAFNPSLLAATTVMLFLPNPKRLLLGYLLGAYTTSIAVGLAIEYWLNGSGAVSTTKHTLSPILDITLGLLALLIALVIGKGELADRHRRRKAEKPKKTPRWQRILSKGSARDTFVVGVLLSFPGATYLAALDEIHKQNLRAAGVVLTVIAVTVISLTLLELPLISYAVAPKWTPAAVERSKAWVGLHGRRAVALGATVIGVALIVLGTIGLVG